MRRLLSSLKSDVKGATAVEYGLIIALIVLVMIAALSSVATKTNEMWNNVTDKVTNA